MLDLPDTIASNVCSWFSLSVRAAFACTCRTWSRVARLAASSPHRIDWTENMALASLLTPMERLLKDMSNFKVFASVEGEVCRRGRAGIGRDWSDAATRDYAVRMYKGAFATSHGTGGIVQLEQIL